MTFSTDRPFPREVFCVLVASDPAQEVSADRELRDKKASVNGSSRAAGVQGMARFPGNAPVPNSALPSGARPEKGGAGAIFVRLMPRYGYDYADIGGTQHEAQLRE